MVPDIAVIVNPRLPLVIKARSVPMGMVSPGSATITTKRSPFIGTKACDERMLFQQEKVIGRSQGSARLMLASTRLPSDTSILARS